MLKEKPRLSVQGRPFLILIFGLLFSALVIMASASMFWIGGGDWTFWREAPPFESNISIALTPYLGATGLGTFFGLLSYFLFRRIILEDAIIKDFIGVIGVALTAAGIGLAVVMSTEAAQELEGIQETAAKAGRLASEAQAVASDANKLVVEARSCIEVDSLEVELESLCISHNSLSSAIAQLEEEFESSVFSNKFSRYFAARGDICRSFRGLSSEEYTEKSKIFTKLDANFDIDFQNSWKRLSEKKIAIKGLDCSTIKSESSNNKVINVDFEVKNESNDFIAYYLAPMLGLFGVGLEFSTLFLIFAFYNIKKHEEEEGDEEKDQLEIQIMSLQQEVRDLRDILSSESTNATGSVDTV